MAEDNVFDLRDPGDKPPKRGRKPKVDFTEPLTAFYAQIGMVITAVPKYRNVGIATVKQAPVAAQAWNEWAKQSEGVRKALETFVKVSAGGAVVAAHAPIIIALLIARNPEIETKLAEAFGDGTSGNGSKIPQARPVE
jgi:hypothetical protein